MPWPLSSKSSRTRSIRSARQDRNLVAIRSDDLSRPQRELLMKQGFLQEVMKGWYIPARPDAGAGESTA